MPQQRVLDLRRVGVEAADDEHVLRSADDAQPAGVVEHAEVAGAQPAVGRQGRGGGVGIVEVVGHDAPAPQQDLPRRTCRDVSLLVVHDAQLEPGPRPAHRGGDGFGVVARPGGGGRPRLGQPVPGDDDRERQLVVEPADELDGDVGCPGDGHAEARQVVGVAVGQVEDRLVERGGAGEHRHPLGCDRGEDGRRIEHRHREHGGPRGDRGQDPRLEAEHVEVRVDHQVAVAGGEARHRHPVRGHLQRPAVGLDDALRAARGARREQDVRRVLGPQRRRAPPDLGARLLGGPGQELVPALAPARPALRARTTVPRAGSSSARASAMAAWSVPRKSATVTSTRAPLRDRISRTSAALNRVLTGTSTAPAWKVPRAATIHSAQLYAQMATRSPGSVPAATRADAKASASAASSR